MGKWGKVLIGYEGVSVAQENRVLHHKGLLETDHREGTFISLDCIFLFPSNLILYDVYLIILQCTSYIVATSVPIHPFLGFSLTSNKKFCIRHRPLIRKLIFFQATVAITIINSCLKKLVSLVPDLLLTKYNFL